MAISFVENPDGTITLSSSTESEIAVLPEELVALSSANIEILSYALFQISDELESSGVRLVWDSVGNRVYESGLDRGVLYLPDGSAVVWNGLTSVIEEFDQTTTPIYFDGMKISDNVVLGEFSATMKAITYPDEFIELEGLAELREGVFLGDQPPQTFGLCYRTQVGNDLAGDVVGYKIHILYNVTAIPKEKTYATLSSDPSLVEFEWELYAVPEEVPGFRPTAHIIINTLDLDPWLLEEIEGILYGTTAATASLVPMSELVTMINEWFRIKITDNGDGTWSATSEREGLITLQPDGFFLIIQANAVYLNESTYVISDTVDAADVPQIRIDDNGDGTWTASTDHDNLITISPEGVFEIRNATAIFTSANVYKISDTIDD